MEILVQLQSVMAQLNALTQASSSGGHPAMDQALAHSLQDILARVQVMISTPRGSNEKGFAQLEGNFAGIFNILHESDNQPTSQVHTAVMSSQDALLRLKGQWRGLQQKDLSALNESLKKAGLTPVK